MYTHTHTYIYIYTYIYLYIRIYPYTHSHRYMYSYIYTNISIALVSFVDQTCGLYSFKQTQHPIDLLLKTTQCGGYCISQAVRLYILLTITAVV